MLFQVELLELALRRLVHELSPGGTSQELQRQLLHGELLSGFGSANSATSNLKSAPMRSAAVTGTVEVRLLGCQGILENLSFKRRDSNDGLLGDTRSSPDSHRHSKPFSKSKSFYSDGKKQSGGGNVKLDEHSSEYWVGKSVCSRETCFRTLSQIKSHWDRIGSLKLKLFILLKSAWARCMAAKALITASFGTLNLQIRAEHLGQLIVARTADDQ